jgi:hypothetical protein
VAFSEEFLAKAVDMLQDCLARRAGAKAVRNGIPRNVDLVTNTFVVNVEKKLLSHARTCRRVSASVREEVN